VSDGVRTYVWNARDQLVEIKQGTASIASFGYDPLGRRVSKTEGGQTISYLYDGLDAVQETQGGAVNPILTGLGIDERYARNEASGRAYFLSDALGSTRALTNASGSLIQRYDYTPYGQTSQASAGTTNPYQYTGRERDASGLYYYRARYYSSSVGRFLSEDSIGLAGGVNPYAYVNGDPLSYRDPSGNCPMCLIPVVWGLIEIGLSIYDIYDTGKTLLDPCVGRGEKAASVGLLLVGMALPGGGYGAIGRKVSKKAIGFASGLADTAMSGMRGGGGHAIRHLEGVVIPNVGSLQSRVDAFKNIARPILENPTHTADWKIGATQGRAFLGNVGGHDVVIVVAKDGPLEGKVISSFIPDANQLKIILER
ncbi:RHS repeat domain-containing protein, partial [Xanthomonas sacchari]